MLSENEELISFTPGSIVQGRKFLGRIIVHDRVQVESTVLPRYFNHSSFASLRRQLNYFSFVRMGKGRQRESSYTNDYVVNLDDILLLKRRPNKSRSRMNKKDNIVKDQATTDEEDEYETDDDHETMHSNQRTTPTVNVTHTLPRNSKRRNHKIKQGVRTDQMTTTKPRSRSPSHIFVSEDENYSDNQRRRTQPSIALDLTQPATDGDVLVACRDLLQLASGKPWGY